MEARAAGLSWTEIGELVGTKGRAAQRRYAAVSSGSSVARESVSVSAPNPAIRPTSTASTA